MEPLFPIKQAEPNDQLIKTACRLYRQSLLAVLPLSLLAVVIYYAICFGDQYLPQQWMAYYKQLAMFASLVLLPLLAMMVSIMDHTGKGLSFSYGSIIGFTLQRFLSLLGALLSLLLLPLIILACGIALYLFLGIQKTPEIVLFIVRIFILLAIFATLMTKIFAPILVITHEQDANNAIEYSSKLVKGSYWRTLIFTLYAILWIAFLVALPRLSYYYFPAYVQKFPFWQLQAAGLFLLALLGPWSLSFMIAQQYNLQAKQGQH